MCDYSNPTSKKGLVEGRLRTQGGGNFMMNLRGEQPRLSFCACFNSTAIDLGSGIGYSYLYPQRHQVG